MPIREMPQSNKQHAVPQNIMDVEFKLIGDLTMRQFTYLAVFLGVAYVIYTFTLPPFFKWPIISLIVLVGVAFAFLPYEERGLDEWIVNFFRAVYAEQQYIWRKNPLPPSAFLYQSLSMVRQELITLAPTASRRKLENYLEYQYQKKEILDPYEKLEAEYIQKVKDAFGDYSKNVTTAVALDDEFMESSPQEMVPETSSTKNIITGVQIETLPQEAQLIEGEENIAISSNEIENNQEILEKQQLIEKTQTPTVETYGPAVSTNLPSTSETPIITKQTSAHIARPSIMQRASSSFKQTLRPAAKKFISRKVFTAPGDNNEILLRPITPDMHAGRKLTNLTPFQGSIVLPIRGERTLKTSDEMESASDVVKKAEQLKTYIQQLKQSEKINLPPKEKSSYTEYSVEDIQVRNEAEELIQRFEKEKEGLLTKMGALKTHIQISSTETDPQTKEKNSIAFRELEEKITQTQSTITKLREQVAAINVKKGGFIAEEPEINSSKLGIIPDNLQPQIPNTIAGIVRNIRGMGLANVLLIIKNGKNEPVRAVKTNPLGEFTITNPLPNGSYNIEVDANNSTGFSFDIINFDAKGEIIPAMEFVGN
ncbi:PrgI family protein [candidate division WWE3 bacterium]|nr:PrgI family protein [candidate division WWE3 bacterium]